MKNGNAIRLSLIVGVLSVPSICRSGMQGASLSQLQATQKAQCERDMALVDSGIVSLQSEISSKRLSEGLKADVKLLLKYLYDLDQWVRKCRNLPFDHGYGGTKAANEFKETLVQKANRLDEENKILLQSLISRWGWFTKSEWGSESDNYAWHLVQHSDHDLPFQKKILALLEPLVTSGETDRSHYALLFDRVSVNEGRFQRFGTQGFCIGKGKWIPRPIEDPANVDARRKAMGLLPMADYIHTFREICQEDETERALKTQGLPSQKP
ncbi:MAG: hypothetical protein HYZ13_03355 [Acidobacteria bacterium]|nr:hypothetical protein [Acidobacteriota bacterium]